MILNDDRQLTFSLSLAIQLTTQLKIIETILSASWNTNVTVSSLKQRSS